MQDGAHLRRSESISQRNGYDRKLSAHVVDVLPSRSDLLEEVVILEGDPTRVDGLRILCRPYLYSILSEAWVYCIEGRLTVLACVMVAGISHSVYLIFKCCLRRGMAYAPTPDAISATVETASQGSPAQV